ncbi:hypothetical protein PR202_ga11344 [Eleusine coracana subsp. coracana]|uniref:Uncharacterized protein n=1 Tax=Eleusine coracana subsp. coracana TaxID=191504 RepID=A0AAV5C9C6_ELECO|nr:hypothetical protein PR202_ga11344 [Eleusine coracana subsp. coracana]
MPALNHRATGSFALLAPLDYRRLRFHVVLRSCVAFPHVLLHQEARHGGGGVGNAAAAAATTEATAEEDNEGNGEPDGDEAVGEELLEDEDSLSAGEHWESDGEEVEADDEESLVYCEDSGSGGDEESMEEEEEEDDDDGDEGSPEPISPAPSLPHARAGGTVVEDVMVADADALECGVCFLPLKPPIFQSGSANSKEMEERSKRQTADSPSSEEELILGEQRIAVDGKFTT